MSQFVTERRVKRALVMLNFADGPDDVFDLTELAREIAAKSPTEGIGPHVSVEMEIALGPDYAADWTTNQTKPLKTDASWRVAVNFRSSDKAGFLEDAVNAGMPDSLTTENLKKVLKKMEEKAAKLRNQITNQRLTDAATVRAQHPIARVSINAQLEAPKEAA